MPMPLNKALQSDSLFRSANVLPLRYNTFALRNKLPLSLALCAIRILKMRYKIGEGVSLKEHVLACEKGKQLSEWMIAEGIGYSMNMVVYPVYLENWDIEPEEYEEVEDQVLSSGNGYGNILNTDQILDVVTNLKAQKSNYNDKELENALNYYSSRDTFIEL